LTSQISPQKAKTLTIRICNFNGLLLVPASESQFLRFRQFFFCWHFVPPPFSLPAHALRRFSLQRPIMKCPLAEMLSVDPIHSVAAIDARPLSVSRYLCNRLLGLSGMVISINPSSEAGLR
jgi:hypothetical protein